MKRTIFHFIARQAPDSVKEHVRRLFESTDDADLLMIARYSENPDLSGDATIEVFLRVRAQVGKFLYRRLPAHRQYHSQIELNVLGRLCASNPPSSDAKTLRSLVISLVNECIDEVQNELYISKEARQHLGARPISLDSSIQSYEGSATSIREMLPVEEAGYKAVELDMQAEAIKAQISEMNPEDQELWELLKQGLDSTEIGKLLHLQPDTVRHRKKVLLERLRYSLR